MATIDLNSDIGEGYGAWHMGDDPAMLSVVTSANIACGFHAGDPSGLLRTLRTAADIGVAVGAHVSYPDRVGFGRRDLDVASEDLVADVIYQIGALQGLARAAGTRVGYVKPHGALYNRIANDPRQGHDVIAAVKAVDPDLVLMGLAGSPLLALAAREGLAVAAEAFADRAYAPTGALVSRREPGAILHDVPTIVQRMLRLAREGTIEASDGSIMHIQAQSICVHGDNPAAVAASRALRQAFEAEGIGLRSFAPAPTRSQAAQAVARTVTGSSVPSDEARTS